MVSKDKSLLPHINYMHYSLSEASGPLGWWLIGDGTGPLAARLRGGPSVGLEPWLWSDEWCPMVLGGVAGLDFPLWAGALADYYHPFRM